MKVGDLIKCLFQPSTSAVENGCAMPMEHHIEGEFGIVVKVRPVGIHRILFPQFGYEHDLSSSALEIINNMK